MTLSKKLAGAGLAMSTDRSIIPSFFISVDDQELALNSIRDIRIDGDCLVLVFPSISYRVEMEDVCLGGGDMFIAFIDHLRSGKDFLLSLCDANLNIRSSVEAALTL